MLAFATVALRRLLRDRSNIFFVAIFPLLLVLLIGLQFGGAAVPRLGVVGADGDDPHTQRLLELLTAQDVEVTLLDTAEDARSAVETGDVDGAVLLPAAVAVAGTSTAEVAFVANPDGSDLALRSTVGAAVAELDRTLRAARVLAATGAEGGAEAALDQLSGLDVGPTVRTVTVGDGGLAEEFAGLGQFDLGASSQLLLFVFITSMTGSAAVVQVRRFGVLDRVLAGPTAPGQVIAGLGLGQLAVALTQSVLILAATAVLFDVSWGDPLATGTVVLAFSFVAAAAGLLLGAVLRNEEQAGGVGVPLSLTLAAVGGSMAPLEVLPAALQQVARVTPHGQGNLAFAEIVRRGGGVGDVATELAALVLMGLVLSAAAALVLRRRMAAAG